jgi:hypothetical protein
LEAKGELRSGTRLIVARHYEAFGYERNGYRFVKNREFVDAE